MREHEKEIHTKLVEILKELVENACKKILTRPWACGPGDGSVGVGIDGGGGSSGDGFEADSVMQTLMKQTDSLHRALTALLDEQSRDSIFQRIANGFSATLCSSFSRVEPRPEAMLKVSLNVRFVQDRYRFFSSSKQVWYLKQMPCTPKRLRALAGVGEGACSDLDVFVT